MLIRGDFNKGTTNVYTFITTEVLGLRFGTDNGISMSQNKMLQNERKVNG